MLTSAIVNHIPESLWCGRIMIINGSVHILFCQDSWTCRAIIKEKVIAIDPVLWAIVLDQRFPNPLFFRLGQVEYLFGDVAAPHLIFDNVILVVRYAKLVIGFSFGEAVDEVGLIEGKDTIIKNVVDFQDRVLDTQGGMAIDGENLRLIGCAGHQTDLSLVTQRFLSVSGKAETDNDQ